jgi:hypothetical protein
MAVVLDAGALIAVERGDSSVGAWLRMAQQDREPVRNSAAVIAPVWRHGATQAQLARVVAGVEVRALDDHAGRSLSSSGTAGRAMSSTVTLPCWFGPATPCSPATSTTWR